MSNTLGLKWQKLAKGVQKMLDFELNSIHLVRLSYKTRQRCKPIFHFPSKLGLGEVKMEEKPIGTPSNKVFSGEGQKIGAFLVQLFLR